VESIIISGTSFSIPLRYGALETETTQIYLNGTRLSAGKDYTLDTNAGIVYLKVPHRKGDMLRVDYRYDSSPEAQNKKASSLPTMRMELGGTGANLYAGLGVAERSGDGNVTMSNVFGVAGNLKFGKSASLRGGVFYSERERPQSQGYFSRERLGMQGDGSEKSHAILQDLGFNAMGGTISASFQDVSAAFTGSDALNNAGFNGDQLVKERGLKRTSLQMNGLKFGSTKFSNGYRSVRDGGAMIEWRNLVVDSDAFGFGFSSQKVDRNFRRFQDLAENDRGQLQREAGMSRMNQFARLGNDKRGVKFNRMNIDDGSGKQIKRSLVKLGYGSFSFEGGTQEVENGFSRLGSLLPEEQQLYARESGLRRDWFSVAGAGWNVSDSRINNANSGMQATMAGIKTGAWSVDYFRLNVDNDFRQLPMLQPGELESWMKATGNSIEPGLALRPQDRQRFMTSTGIDRRSLRVSHKAKGFGLTYGRLDLGGRKDSTSINEFGLSAGSYQLDYRSQRVGKEFGEWYSLLPIEQERLGPILGIDRQDLKLTGKNFNLQNMTAKTAGGTASRTNINVKLKNLDLSLNQRRVDKGFTNVGQIVDPERDLLATMVGLQGLDFKGSFTPNNKLRINAQVSNYSGADSALARQYRNIDIYWKPDGRTELSVLSLRNKNDLSSSLLFFGGFDQLAFIRDLGKGSSMKFLRENHDFGGSNASNPSSTRTMAGIKTPLGKSANITTERSETLYSDGTKETIFANTIDAHLTKEFGFNLSETISDRPGQSSDTTQRNYGLYYKFSNGMMLSYGYVRNMNGQDTGTSNTSIGLSSGNIGNINVGAAQQVRNSFDQDLGQQHGVNLALSSAKPFRLGGISNFRWTFSLNAMKDRQRWPLENRLIGFSGNLGESAFSYEYKSQMSPTGIRGIDRTFQFQTSQDPNRKLVASMLYKVRTLPWNQQIMIRNFNLAWKMDRNWTLSHQMITNPEQMNGGVLLGSVPLPTARTAWKLDFGGNPDTTFGASWFEERNLQSRQIVRVAGANLSLFNRSGSPVKLFFGLDENSNPNARNRQIRYGLEFNQRPGPNQSLSFAIGNTAFNYAVPDGFRRDNLNLRIDWSIRF
jgi:hypothetical protein